MLNIFQAFVHNNIQINVLIMDNSVECYVDFSGLNIKYLKVQFNIKVDIVIQCYSLLVITHEEF